MTASFNAADEFDVPGTAKPPPISESPKAPVIDTKSAPPEPLPAPAAPAEEFPKDLAQCLTLLTRLDNDMDDQGNIIVDPRAQPTAQQRARAARLQRLRKHVFRLQQGGPIIPATSQELRERDAAEQAARVREGQRLTELLERYPALREKAAKINRQP